jgi:crossover junction endodeoxyribonuclease RusA
VIEFVVPGRAVPQGGMTAFVKGNRAFVTHKRPKELGDFRARVALAAQHAGAEMVKGAVRLDVAFSLIRPKSHMGTGRNAHLVKGSSPRYPTTNPDIDKLLRSLLDALTQVCFADDNQVTQINVTKSYTAPGDAPCTYVRLTELEAAQESLEEREAAGG